MDNFLTELDKKVNELDPELCDFLTRVNNHLMGKICTMKVAAPVLFAANLYGIAEMRRIEEATKTEDVVMRAYYGAMQEYFEEMNPGAGELIAGMLSGEINIDIEKLKQ